MYFFLLLIALAALGASILGRDRVQWYANNVLMRLGGIWFGFRPPKTILPPEVSQPKTLPSGPYIAFDRTIRLVSHMLEKPSEPINLIKIRAGFHAFAYGLEKDITCEIRSATRWEQGKEQTFNMELYIPPGDYNSSRLILFTHGGGLYGGGGLGTHRHALGELSRLTHTRVLAVDYRVIPEASYDTPIKDTVRAWDYATNREWGMGIEPHNIIVAGESAGGTLASLLVTYLQRRTQYKDENHLPRAVLLISTFDFSANESPSRQSNGIPYASSFACDPLVSTRILKWNTALLSQCGAPDDTGRFYSSLYQATMDAQQYGLKPYQGFPPTMIICGRYETLVDDSEAILKAMQDASVDVKYSFPDWYIHMQFLFAGLNPEATASLQEMADYINTQFAK